MKKRDEQNKKFYLKLKPRYYFIRNIRRLPTYKLTIYCMKTVQNNSRINKLTTHRISSKRPNMRFEVSKLALAIFQELSGRVRVVG